MAYAGNKFRQRKHEMKDMGGDRAQANALKAKPDQAREEELEEQVAPGIHDEVASVAAQHGPAHEVHILHDHEGGVHHVHSVHADGYENHSDHSTAEEAHSEAGEAAGVANKNGEYPEGHEQTIGQRHPKAKAKPVEKDEDDYESEPLD